MCMIKKLCLSLYFISLIGLNTSCSKHITTEQLNICNQMLLEHKEQLHGFENAMLTVAEVVGDSFYSSKLSGILVEVPDGAFFCEWETEPTKTYSSYNYVTVMFVPDVGIDKLLWLSESQILEDGTRRPIRSFDYTTSSFDSWE